MLCCLDLPNLTEQARSLARLVISADDSALAAANMANLERFLCSLHPSSAFCSSFANGIAKTWRACRAQRANADLLDLCARLERRQIMLVKSAAWVWLLRTCYPAVEELATRLHSDPHSLDDVSDWISSLVRDVYLTMNTHRSADFTRPQYLPHIPSPSTHSFHVSKERVGPACIVDRVTKFVQKTIRDWLEFPHNTDMLSGFFVFHLLSAVGNPDVLLIPEIWTLHSCIKTKVLRLPYKRHSSLSLADLDPFIHTISSHPISRPTSEEACMLRNFSDELKRILPAAHQFHDFLIHAASKFIPTTPAPPLLHTSSPTSTPTLLHSLPPTTAAS